MKLAALVALAATLGLPAAAAKGPQPVLGIDWNDRTGTRLARFDPATLAIQPGRKVFLAGHASPWAFSPDRTKLVLGGDGASLRFVDARKMRVLGDLGLGLAGFVDYLDWAQADRLVVLVHGKADDALVVVVDAARRRVIRTIPFEERSAYGAARSASGMAFLLGAPSGRGLPVVVVVDADGALRTTTLDQMSVGYTEYGDGRVDWRRPGFAVDPDGRRAFVVDADFSVAEIDLESGQVAYHRQSTRALAKFVVGPSRVARWLGNGMLAVAGADYHGADTPAGLRLIDTGTWTWRVVDPEVADFDVGRGVISGTDNPLDSEPRHYSVYGTDGSFRYGVDVSAQQSLVVQGSYAYVCRGLGLVRVLDARTGAVLRRYSSARLPICGTLLYGQSSTGTSSVAPG